jgi:hypothetical protein
MREIRKARNMVSLDAGALAAPSAEKVHQVMKML